LPELIHDAGKTYLDHGGATVYAASLIDAFSREMLANLYGNPHSASAPAELSGHMVDDIREKTLRFFGADPKHFDLVFVPNATGAIKMVMDCFRDIASDNSSSGSFKYYYHKDSHTSLVGIREVTKYHHCFRSDGEVEEWLDGNIEPITTSASDSEQLSLFAYPGQSNMTGRRLPLSWSGRLRESRKRSHRSTYTLLDAAALAMTSPLTSLFSNPDNAPDFTALSFYKIFGFPDLGALIVRRDSAPVLTWRRFFGGGTIDMVTVLDQALHWKREGDIHNRLEDGTLGFHNILALGCAMDVHRQLYGDMENVSRHVSWLGRQMFERLEGLRHGNGKRVCVIYNEPGNDYSDRKLQGGTVAFNVQRADGRFVAFADVEEAANRENIYVRAGGLCNPGGIASYLSLP
jgi:molybdenum cofactor sulfurtransferase